MFDTVQFVAQSIATPDALSAFALRIIGALILGVFLAVLFICAGFVLAQCCPGPKLSRRSGWGTARWWSRSKGQQLQGG